MEQQDYMREEINSQLEILEKFIANFSITEAFNDKLFKKKNFDEIWLTGSGDSHCVALFGASYFNQLGIKSTAFVPMDLSNFYMKSSSNPLLIAISVSGKTPRVIEVVKKYKKLFQSSIIGLTDNPNSSLFRETDIPILIGASPPKILTSSNYVDKVASKYIGYHHDVAQTKTFFANLLWILGIGVILSSEKKNKVILIKTLENVSIKMKNWLVKAEIKSKDQILLYPQKTIFIGSGLFSGLSQFAQYKWFEFTFPGLKQDIEEYAHTHYFTTDKETSLIFISPFDKHLKRTEELIFGALVNLIQPQIFVITTATNLTSDQEKNLHIIQTPKINSELNGLWQEISFYLYSLIYIEWLAYTTAKSEGLNTNTFRGGVEGEKYVKGSFQTIRKSKIIE